MLWRVFCFYRELLCLSLLSDIRLCMCVLGGRVCELGYLCLLCPAGVGFYPIVDFPDHCA